MNTLNKEDLEAYESLYFTERGTKAIQTYLDSLTKLWITKTDYPFKLGMVVGIPMMTYAQEIKSKDELEGRIKAYAQILGIDKITIKQNDGQELTLDLNSKK